MNEKATHMELATSAVCTAWTGYRVGGGTDRSACTRPRRRRGGGSARQGMRGNRPTSGCAYLSKRADRPGCSLAIVHSAGCLSVVSAWTWAALVPILPPHIASFPLPTPKNNSPGATRARTWVLGTLFRIPSDNHYTIAPCRKLHSWGYNTGFSTTRG